MVASKFLTLFPTGGGSKVPAAPKMPSKLRKSKKIQKNNYKFAPPTILPTPPLALLFTQCIEMLQNQNKVHTWNFLNVCRKNFKKRNFEFLIFSVFIAILVFFLSKIDKAKKQILLIFIYVVALASFFPKYGHTLLILFNIRYYDHYCKNSKF